MVVSKTVTPRTPPHIFAIETVLGCNLACVECAVGAGLIKRKYGKMSLDVFKIISDKIKPYCKMLYLHIWGEPMLNPDIFEMIKLSSPFAKTNISTNGNTLTKEMAIKLIDSGVSELIVSIDGVTQDTYGIYRKNGDVNKAFKSLTWLATHNMKTGNKVNIYPQFIVFEHNKHEMEEFRRICSSLNLESTISFKSPYLRKNSILQNSGISHFERKIADTDSERKKAMRQCANPDEVFTILLDGTVVPCCYDHNAEVKMGNILQQSVEDIWNTPKYIGFRNALRNGNAPDYCLKNCLTY